MEFLSIYGGWGINPTPKITTYFDSNGIQTDLGRYGLEKGSQARFHSNRIFWVTGEPDIPVDSRTSHVFCHLNWIFWFKSEPDIPVDF